jgi:hypothetical protein
LPLDGLLGGVVGGKPSGLGLEESGVLPPEFGRLGGASLPEPGTDVGKVGKVNEPSSGKVVAGFSRFGFNFFMSLVRSVFAAERSSATRSAMPGV